MLLVASAGALGAATRYLVVAFATWQNLPPIGTMAVNVLGCFAVGVALANFGEEPWFHEYGGSLIVVGFLGSFTTFSAFSLDSVQLMLDGRIGQSLLYITVTVIGCIVATYGGLKLAQI